MDCNKELRVLEKLMTFKFGVKTDTKKGILNNRDAVAFLFWHCGSLRFAEVRSMMQTWRGEIPHYSGGTSKPLFTYLFNAGRHGNYGSVGETAMTRGNVMYTNGGGKADIGQFGEKGTSFRRTFWFRLDKGVYAPTLECGKRMLELGLNAEIE